MKNGATFPERTPEGTFITCRTCKCTDGRTQCDSVEGCVTTPSTTPMPTTTTSTQIPCELTGCVEGDVCHTVNETWKISDCETCKCTGPNSKSCEKISCQNLDCPISKGLVAVTLPNVCCPVCKDICVGEALRCDGKCDCPKQSCSDESEALCSKFHQTLKKFFLV